MIIVGDVIVTEIIVEMVPTIQSWIDLIEQLIIHGRRMIQLGIIVKMKQGMYQHLRIVTRGGRPIKTVQRRRPSHDREVDLHHLQAARPVDRLLGTK